MKRRRLSIMAERRKRYSAEATEPLVLRYLRKRRCSTLMQLGYAIYSCPNFNYLLRETLEDMTQRGVIATIRFTAGKTPRAYYCLKHLESKVRLEVIPIERTKHEILASLESGPKCRNVLMDKVAHPGLVPRAVALLSKQKIISEGKIGAREACTLRGREQELESLASAWYVKRIVERENSILKIIRRCPGCATSTILHATGLRNKLLVQAALRNLALLGVVRMEKRGNRMARWYPLGGERCPTCGKLF